MRTSRACRSPEARLEINAVLAKPLQTTRPKSKRAHVQEVREMDKAPKSRSGEPPFCSAPRTQKPPPLAASLQRAVVEVMNAVYEQDFLGFSYGFRPGRGQHDALDALAVAIERKKVNWVLDADISDFFTGLDQCWLAKFLEHRIADKRVLRLIQKWLRAAVIEDGEWSSTEAGTAQGASVSPLLSNVYLHYVL
jgi:hypothetical protein